LPITKFNDYYPSMQATNTRALSSIITGDFVQKTKLASTFSVAHSRI
jgi:hypothetical protein